MQFSVLSSKKRDLQHWGRKKIRSTDIVPRFVQLILTTLMKLWGGDTEKLDPRNVLHLEKNGKIRPEKYK